MAEESRRQQQKKEEGESFGSALFKAVALAGGALAIGYAVSKGIDAIEQNLSEERCTTSKGDGKTHPPPQPGSECPICWTQYSPPLEILPCKHLFHRNCITRWITEKWTCPICKEEIDRSIRGEYLQRAKESSSK